MHVGLYWGGFYKYRNNQICDCDFSCSITDSGVREYHYTKIQTGLLHLKCWRKTIVPDVRDIAGFHVMVLNFKLKQGTPKTEGTKRLVSVNICSLEGSLAGIFVIKVK